MLGQLLATSSVMQLAVGHAARCLPLTLPLAEKLHDAVAAIATRQLTTTARNVHVQRVPEETSTWSSVPQAPPDSILGITEAYKADKDPRKLNLGVGAYRTEEGNPLVLNVVRKAEQMLLNDPTHNKEYIPIGGSPDFCRLSRELAFGSYCLPCADNRVATLQTISGTGALRVGAEFLSSYQAVKEVYIPNPTWGNHGGVFASAGFQVKKYRYYHEGTKGLDIQGLLTDLNSATPGSVVLLHACAHNPTGVDPSTQEWEDIQSVIRRRDLLPFFDMAYQGFASGDVDVDAAALRMFARDGGELVLAQSFAKNMGMYGERAGAVSLVCHTPEITSCVESQVKGVIRRMYSSPPKHGAAVVTTVLKDAALAEEWKEELKGMAGRIHSMRQVLYNELQRANAPGSWDHILNQIGMFSFTGLSKAQVERLTKKWHIYMTMDGRISMAGLSASNAGYLAEAMADAVREP